MIGAIIAKMKARSVYDALSRHNLDEFLAGWAEEATYAYPGNLSVSGEIEGKEAIRDWFEKYIEQFPITSYTVKNICVQNIFALGGTNVLAVESDVKLYDREQKEFEINQVCVITLKGGKSVSVRVYIADLEVAKRAWGEK